MDQPVLLNRYEVARIMGLRALQLDEGATPFAETREGDSSLYIAARELHERRLDALVCREGHHYPVVDCRPRGTSTWWSTPCA